jgi:hypothetical protein
MATVNIARGPFGIAQITAKSAVMKSIGTLAPIEPEITRIYEARADTCVSKARKAAREGRRDAVEHFTAEATFWKSHADAISSSLRGNRT